MVVFQANSSTVAQASRILMALGKQQTMNKYLGPLHHV